MKPKHSHFELIVKCDHNALGNHHTKHLHHLAPTSTRATRGTKTNTSRNRKKQRKASVDSSTMLMNQQKLCSAKIDDLHVKYGVAELHQSCRQIKVTPIEGIYEFKTDFTYIDSNCKEVEAANCNESVDATKSNQIQRPICRYESEHERRCTRINYNQMRKSFDSEPCIELKLITKRLPRFRSNSMPQIRKSSGQETFESSVKVSLTRPSDSTIQSDRMNKFANGTSTAPISFNSIVQMKPPDQLQCLLINCKVLRFDEIVRLVSFRMDSARFLVLLQEFANLVNGNWVVKSSLLFPSQLSRDLLQSFEGNTRLSLLFDCLCFCFTKKSTWKRCALLQQVKASFDEMLEMLQMIARFDAETQSWSFVNEIDETFLKK